MWTLNVIDYVDENVHTADRRTVSHLNCRHITAWTVTFLNEQSQLYLH